MSMVKTVHLSDFCATGSGGTPSRSKLERYYEGGTIPWIKSGELRESVINRAEEYVTDAALKESSIKLVPAGAILLAMYGATVGRLGILGIEATTNQAVCHIVPDPKLAATRYVYHALSSQVPNLIFMGVGGAQPNINQGIIKSLAIPLPPLLEQRRIAAILDQADALRAKRREALAQLDSLTQSIFIEMFGDPVSNPRGWKQESLENFFQFRTGKLDSNAAVANGAYPFFTCAKEDSQIDTFAFDCEALLLAGNNATADYSVKHYKGKFNAYQRTYVITLKNQENSYQYAAFFLENHLLELKRMSKGSGTKYLTLALLNQIRIPVPPVELQCQFVTRLAELHRIRAMFKKSLLELDTLFASLQHRAFRGEL